MKMSQEFHVICCYSCDTFQVHQVKKSGKWQCKLCGVKQSVKMVFALGSAVDCRKYVQSANLSTGQKREQSLTDGNVIAFPADCHQQMSSSSAHSNLDNLESIWTVFLDDTKPNFKDIDTNKEEKSNSMGMESLQPESLNKSLKRKSDDSFYGKSDMNNLKSKLRAYSSGEAPDSDGIGKQCSPKSDGKTPANTCKLLNKFTHKSNDLHASFEASQNDEQSTCIASTSKWHKFI